MKPLIWPFVVCAALLVAALGLVLFSQGNVEFYNEEDNFVDYRIDIIEADSFYEPNQDGMQLSELQRIYSSDPPDSGKMIMYAVQKLGFDVQYEDVVNLLNTGHPLLTTSRKKTERWSVSRNCFICNVGVMTIQNLLRIGKARDLIAESIAAMCKRLQIEQPDVCDGIVKEYKDEVLTVLDRLGLDPEEVCGSILGEDCGAVYDPYAMWYISWPHPLKPPVHPPTPPSPSAPKLRILQLSDIHMDFSYKPGSNAKCGKPLCCRADSGTPNQTSDGAGYWGDYRSCDTPTWTLESLFKHLASNEKIDVIYWTGDLLGHNVWQQTRNDSIKNLEYLKNMFIKHLPHVAVYSSLGNHEGVPVNSFPPPFIRGNRSVSWLYDELISSWGHWLPNTTHASISRGGFYTVLAYPGLRLISLNINYCNNENWWLLLNSTDPASELRWLGETLQKAENSGEKVHIIGHIPPGTPNCLKAWSWNYYNIVNRYESTITGQFFGHTHYDELEIFYDPNSNYQRPVSVAYIGPSVTPFSNLNPGYRIYTVDGNYNESSWQVLDHETYVMNLTEANLSSKKQPQWKLEYRAKEAYNMTSLYPADWQALIERMGDNSSEIQNYYRHYFKLHAPGSTCDDNCRRSLICGMKSGRSKDPNLCRNISSTITPESLLEERTLWHMKYKSC